jgi:hypothetical protein
MSGKEGLSGGVGIGGRGEGITGESTGGGGSQGIKVHLIYINEDSIMKSTTVGKVGRREWGSGTIGGGELVLSTL